MKVFNLACGHDHRFEGWFASADDYQGQLERGLIECPVCGDRQISKLPSAPRLNLSGASDPASSRGPVPVEGGATAGAAPTPQQLQAMWMKLARHLVESTEDVGENFAEEARRIHYQEAPERGIRGVASAEERAELADEGIEVFAFPLPRSMKDPIQ
ncbi:DUF1178 family protein [Burkholderiaceae bacterium FT117]|uniref:DUF1178 family protein n=1 Tax=Zeimonas sediminis TaxID=2944268 RepID=UPI0023431508|nr:DUF1178 family protein [Zeimonas sediminis]MCM5569159.1 DUF1178 family protein [Zeimonas sediminis]